MNDAPLTRPSLLLRIRDAGDQEAWSEFIAIYSPMIHGFARRQGLQDADAADVAQEVLQSVSKAAARFDYDPRKGAFRGWLYTVTRNKLRNLITRTPRYARGSGDSAVARLLNEQAEEAAGAEDEWNREYEQRLFLWAADKVQGEFQPATWQAFWQTAVENRAAPAVAQSLGLTVGAVYIAKSRVLARLRTQVELVTGDDD